MSAVVAMIKLRTDMFPTYGRPFSLLLRHPLRKAVPPSLSTAVLKESGGSSRVFSRALVRQPIKDLVHDLIDADGF